MQGKEEGGACLWRRVRGSVREWRRIGATTEVCRWIVSGVTVPWIQGPPPCFHHGESLREAAPEAKEWFRREATRMLELGAWELADREEWISRIQLEEKRTAPGEAKNFRTVVDLRRVNEFTKARSFRMEGLKMLERSLIGGEWMVSLDLSDGFYALRITPEDRRYFRFRALGVTYQMVGLPMGWTQSPAVFDAFTRTITRYLRAPASARRRTDQAQRRGVEDISGASAGTPVIHYLDDFLFWGPTRQAAAEIAVQLRELMGALGLRINEKKSTMEPVQRLEHLGLVVDMDRQTFEVPQRKMDKIRGMATALLREGSEAEGLVRKRTLAKFTGTVIACRLAIPASRHHLRSLHDVSKSSIGWEGRVRLTRDARRDLRMWARLTDTEAFRLIRRPVTTRVLNTDASLTGWGAVLDSKEPIAGYWAKRYRPGDMAWVEIRAVVLAILSFGPELKGEEVLLFCDNSAIVQAVNTATSRTPRIMSELRALQNALDAHDVSLRARHVYSKANVWADKLSRATRPTHWAITAAFFTELEAGFGPHDLELFATENRAHVRRFAHQGRAPGAEAEPFVLDWRGCNALIVAPWDEIPRVAQRLREAKSNATVVTPYWPAQPWYVTMTEIATSVWKYPAGSGLVTAGRPGEDRLAPWPVVVFRVTAA